MRVRVAWSLLVGAFIAFSAAAAAAATALSLPIERHVLKNGLTVLLMENHESPTIGLTTAFKVGASSEWTGISGATHILEHELFKGTDRIGTKNWAAEKKLLARTEELAQEIKRRENAPGAERDSVQLEALRKEFKEVQDKAREYVIPNQLWETYQNAGATYINGDTGPDITRYYLALPANRLETWMYLESSRLRSPIFREFYTEINNIREERRMSLETQPDGALAVELASAAFVAHPYHAGAIVIGWDADIRTVTRTEIEEYFKRYYAPNQMVIAIVGDINPRATLDMVQAYFGDIPRQPPPPPVETVEPEQQGERRVTREFDAQPQVLIGYHRPAADQPDDAVYRVITEIVNGGRSSRFNKILIEEKQLAASINIDQIWAGERYPTLYGIDAKPRAPHTTQELEDGIYQELDRLKTEPVGARELEKVKNKLDADFLRGMSENFDVARRAASAEATFGDWEVLLRTREGIQQVTPEDIMRVARTTFAQKNRTVATLVPISTEEAAPVSAEAQAEAEAMLAKAVQAMGGEKALAGVKDLTLEADVSITTPGGAIPATSRAEFLFPDRFMGEMGIMGQTQVQGTDGSAWWLKAQGMVMDLPADQLKEARASFLRDTFFFQFPAMKDALRLEALPEKEENMPVVQVLTSDGTKFRFLFDAATGLPQRLRYATKHPMTGQAAEAEETFSDFKEVGGIRLAHQIQTRLDSKDFATQKIRSVKINRGLEPGRFAKPSS